MGVKLATDGNCLCRIDIPTVYVEAIPPTISHGERRSLNEVTHANCWLYHV